MVCKGAIVHVATVDAFVVISTEEEDLEPPDSEGEPPKKRSCNEEMYEKVLTS